MSRLLALFALFLGVPSLAAAQPLITPAELSARLSEPQLRVVDIRDGKDDAGKAPVRGRVISRAHCRRRTRSGADRRTTRAGCRAKTR